MQNVRCRNLHAAAQLGDPIVAYSGLVCRLLGGDAAAAALLCQLWWLTAEGEKAVDTTIEQLEDATGLSKKVQRRARRLLVEKGWLIELRARRGGRPRIFTRVNAPALLAALDAAGRRKPAEQRDLQGPNGPLLQGPDGPLAQGPNGPVSGSRRAPTKKERSEEEKEEEGKARRVERERPPPEQSVLAGDLDDDPKAGSVAVCATVCAVLDREWHGGQRRVVPSRQRQVAWADFVASGGRPSDALKAIHGMRHDDWSGRGDHADLRHVLGKLPAWVRLYEERHARGERPLWPRPRDARPPGGFRPWLGGTFMPADRPPSHGDETALGMGYVFVFDEREWVDPADDPRGLVARHRERYGELNITATARARMEASRG